MTDLKSIFKVYNIESYTQSDANFIQSQGVDFSKTKLKNLLLKNKNKYHFRIHPATQYIFFW